MSLVIQILVVTVNKTRAKKISAELDNLQENTEFFFRNRPELSPEFVRQHGNMQRAMDKRMGIYDAAFDQSDEEPEGGSNLDMFTLLIQCVAFKLSNVHI